VSFQKPVGRYVRDVFKCRKNYAQMSLRGDLKFLSQYYVIIVVVVFLYIYLLLKIDHSFPGIIIWHSSGNGKGHMSHHVLKYISHLFLIKYNSLYLNQH